MEVINMARKRKKQVKKALMGLGSIIGPLVYGYGRERISTAIGNTELAQKLPQTEFTDEAIMLALNFGAKKLGANKNPLGRVILSAQKSIEIARIGQTISDITGNRASSSTENIF